MLGRIKFETYERCYPSRLKRMFQSNINYKTYNDFVPNVKRAVVGNIPPELIRFFPKETRGENIKAFQKALADIAEYLREAYKKLLSNDDFKIYDENYRFSKPLVEMSKKASRRLNLQLREMSGVGQLRARLQIAGHGDFANVFQLSITDADGNKLMHDKAMKVFHYLQEGSAEYKTMHNNYAEANFWTFLKHAAGHSLDKTQITKHYISDMESGYSLTEFIDSDIHRTTSKLNIPLLFGIRLPRDGKCNMLLSGKIYDAGGFEKSGSFTGNPVTIRYLKKLLHCSKKNLPRVLGKMISLAQNPKTPNGDKIQKAIDLFKKLQAVDNNIL